MSTPPPTPIEINATDSVRTFLERMAGQRVELLLRSGSKISGKVEHVNNDAVHLSQISGQEFYDAIVAATEVTAVVVRAR